MEYLAPIVHVCPVLTYVNASIFYLNNLYTYIQVHYVLVCTNDGQHKLKLWN